MKTETIATAAIMASIALTSFQVVKEGNGVGEDGGEANGAGGDDDDDDDGGETA
ncbi:MAG: hypothetical protein WA941_07205 [Nitrososphaeraceae archaeon]